MRRLRPHVRQDAGVLLLDPLIAVFVNHRFRRPHLTEPHQKFTCVHPSDLPLARLARMVRVCLGLHPSAFACFVSWHLLGSGTRLDTGWEMATSHLLSIWSDFAS